MTKRKVTHMRVYKDTLEEINLNFPEVKQADVFDIAYKTSALKLEKRLKEIDFKNNIGHFLYGKKKWEKFKV